jgi:hypothetical protein
MLRATRARITKRNDPQQAMPATASAAVAVVSGEGDGIGVRSGVGTGVGSETDCSIVVRSGYRFEMKLQGDGA